MATTKISLQQLIQAHGKDFAACRSLLPQHHRVFRQLGRCRAAALGVSAQKSTYYPYPPNSEFFSKMGFTFQGNNVSAK